MIDQDALLSYCGISNPDEFRVYYKNFVEYRLMHGDLKRESIWSNNLAVGSRQYIEINQDKFGAQYKMKDQPLSSFAVKQDAKLKSGNDSSSPGGDHLEDCTIREVQNAYNAVFAVEKWVLRGENGFFLNDLPLITNI